MVARRLAATGSSNGGATRPPMRGAGTCSGRFEASLLMPCLKREAGCAIT
jgi:hypothetical protein